MKATTKRSGQSVQRTANAGHVAQQPTSQRAAFMPPNAQRFAFEDKRPVAAAQRQLQALANNSPQVRQLQAIQEMANKHVQTEQTASVQPMAEGPDPASRVPYAGVAQRTIEGQSPAKWSSSMSKKKMIVTKLKAFADIAHNDDIIYEDSELDGFFDAELKDKAHYEFDEAYTMYRNFKHYVAESRDAEGAHGATMHGGTGDQFIVDRVNTPNQPNRASYLLMDEYLKWDSVLKLGAEDLYEAYLRAANQSRGDFGASLGYEMEEPGDGNFLLTQRENFTSPDQTVDVTFGDEDWEITLKSYVTRNGVSDIEDGDNFRLKIGASVEGDLNLSAREVRRAGGIDATVLDVTDVNKTPVAHTGGLAPCFEVDGFGNEKSEPAGGASDLKWVTKY